MNGVTVVALLAAGAMALVAGCVERLDVTQLTPEHRAAAADVYFYENLLLPSGAYQTIGAVEGTSCQATRFEDGPSASEAMNKLRVKTAQMGGNGVIQFLCSNRGASFVPACVRSITCAGTAIKFATDAGGDDKQSGDVISLGSGFFINPRGDVVTNAHVVEGCSTAAVRAGDQRGQGTVLYRDSRADLALIRTGGPAPAFLQLRVSPPVQLAETVVTAGYPLAGLLSSQIHITDGSISSLAGIGDNTTVLQFTAPIQNGNSGGPLVDLGANLVGVNSAGLNPRIQSQNVNFAVKTSAVITFLDSIGAEYRTITSRPTLAKTEVAAIVSRATVQLLCRRSAKPAQS